MSSAISVGFPERIIAESLIDNDLKASCRIIAIPDIRRFVSLYTSHSGNPVLRPRGLDL
jgi:hypothetical protein